MKSRIKYQWVFVVAIFCICAFLATYPAFLNTYFKITMDGQIHFVRFEEIARAFKAHQLPPMVNFMGFGHWGNAFTGMYPWISCLFFIVPQSVFANPIHSIFIGYFFVNLFTLINAYLLTREITHNYYWRFLGTILYEFNTYHLCVLYGRDALGEALAYTFLPLVFLGCIQIWKNKKIGVLSLGIGMGMAVNSHVITMAFTCLIITIIELFRLFKKKLNLKEVLYYIYAAILTSLIACYTWMNMLFLMHNNDLLTPGKGMAPIIPSEMWNSILDNKITDITSQSWNIGIVLFVVLVFLTAQLFTKRKGYWRFWTLGALIIQILTFSWIPYPQAVVKLTAFWGIFNF
ncbi:hypothetical protein [Lactobacillus taiwanensis]|uniref:Membrane protein 6-pyruvoyl-tetrahydropterin synthase-related domain-containing protein n=1 Tax=Lactobacillus taiwanensis TaxID=508451 RepID=A0A256LD99_9LACO|nr:hypothetical protein [Lactobacillus taiwanensis]OYR91133.1 hypothetical protein CBF70_08185 [Lactobacillus taiwanensis]OYR91768.1 hypothetical protein CBF59_05195 [Lactobacillus taiwanensis]OYR94542.1 hypothetical protein CBF58_08960 [Lactobacillus taiwanensis]